MSDEPHIGQTMRINMKTGAHTLTPDSFAAPAGSPAAVCDVTNCREPAVCQLQSHNMSQPIVAIDPGTTESAVVMWDGWQILRAEICPNEVAASIVACNLDMPIFCEMVACYGMSVGKEVFETCLWIGEFRRVAMGHSFHLVYRRDVKLHHCGSARAKDGNVIQALKDKYGAKGTKANPGTTYRLKSHLWQAFAIATMVTEQAIRPCEVAK